jgi:hypothetical protein
VPELIGYDSPVSIFSGAIMNNEPVKHDSQQESGEDILVPTVTDEGLEVASGIERRVVIEVLPHVEEIGSTLTISNGAEAESAASTS